MSHRPDRHEPKVPAWSATYPSSMSHLVYAQFGTQSDAGGDREFIATLCSLLSGPLGARHVDRAQGKDGDSGELVIAYWDDPANFQSWRSLPKVRDWWEGLPVTRQTGYWRELATIPVDHLETLHSTPLADQGVSHFLPLDLTDVHEYWGAARDRIKAAQTAGLERLVRSPLERLSEAPSRGRRVVVRPAGNLCFIRTAQDYSRCTGRERELYETKVAPVLVAGTDYLRTHPEETGCISMRFVQELDPVAGSPLDKTCALAFFASLKDLEQWTKSHPTHEAIYGSFMDMVAESNFSINLALWHEVSVLPEGAIEAEYVNCDPGTGLLPFFPAAAT